MKNIAQEFHGPFVKEPETRWSDLALGLVIYHFV